MEKFLTVLGLLAPLLILVATGYAARALEYFPATAAKGLAAFITKIAVPVALFSMIATQQLADILDGRLILAYLLATAGIASLTFILGRKALGATALRAMTMAFGASTSNAVMIGFALMIAAPAYGAAGPKALTILFLVQSCFLIPIKLALWRGFERGEEGLALAKVGGLLLEALRNPIIAAILAGMGVALVRLLLPESLTATLADVAARPWLQPLTNGTANAADFLARTAVGLALFFMGSTLVGARFWPADRQVLATTLCKLFGHPLLMLVAMTLMALVAGAGFDWATARACVALAAIPMISVYPAVAADYGEDAFAAQAATLTLLVSAVTLTLVLLLTLP